MNRCYSCFKEYGEQFDICPFCGSVRVTEPKEPVYLAPGTVLSGRYVLGETVGAGGFGIIYKAFDTKLETVVAVKEFFPRRIMTRAAGTKDVIINKNAAAECDYRKNRFLAEARNMAKFGAHRSIPNVFEFFEENGTAYIVMELLCGTPLNEYLQQTGGKTDRDFAVMVVNEVGNALISMHRLGIIHRDVAPDNVYICSDSQLRIKLLDLGAARLADSSEDVIDIILKPGYSPIEQYDNSKNIGTWTDVYALGATLYVMLTGIKPDEATNRKIKDTVVPPHLIDRDIPENLSNAVMKAMAIDRHMRFKSVAEFLRAVNGEKKVTTIDKERKRRKRRRLTGVVAALLSVAVAATGVFHVYNASKAQQTLKEASISIWFSASGEDSAEEKALKSVAEDFTSVFPAVEVEIRAIPEEDYLSELSAAAEKGELPTLFESTDATEEILEQASNAEKVMSSDQAEAALFLGQYEKYYSDTKKVPLAIEVPVAYVITSGNTSIDYSDTYFSSIYDFGKTPQVAVDTEYSGLWNANGVVTLGMYPEDSFMDNEANSTAVMLSSTTALEEVKQTLQNYEKRCVYYEKDEISCRFTYEWSIGNGTDSEISTAERLLSLMLGHKYQSILMINTCADGQIPVNKDSFEEKISGEAYAPLGKIYGNFVFKN